MGIFQQSFSFNGVGGVGPGYNAFQAENYANPNQGSPFNPYFPTPGSRQQFQQQRQTNPYASNPNDPSVAGSAIGLVGAPVGASEANLGVDPFQNKNALVRGVTQRPADHAVNFTQQWGIPFAAMIAANRFSRIRVDRRNERAGRMAGRFSRFGSSLTGKSTAETERLAERARSTQGVFEAMGNSIGRGATRGFFKAGRAVGLGGMFGEAGTSAALESGAADTIGAATGVASGLALPFAAAEVGVGVANHAVFNKYTDIRRGSMSLRHNLRNRYFGRGNGQGGDVLSGYGLSRSQATSQATQIEHEGISDFGLSGKQYQAISDYGFRSGMLDNISSSGQISGKVKSLAQEVKVVMEVANMPSVKDAVKSLAKLKNMGASSSGGQASQISSLARGLSLASGAAGTSMGQLTQATSQASQQYQQAGMAPAMGMMASANTYSGFRAAYQVGAISPEMRAIMGGASGFTNTMSGITSQALSSQQARIMGYDASQGGQRDHSFQGLMNGKAMQGMRHHPLETRGRMYMHQHQSAQAMLKSGNISGLLDIYEPQFKEISRIRNGGQPLDNNQKLSIIADQMNLSPEQAQVLGHGMQAEGNSSAFRQQRNAEQAKARNNAYRAQVANGDFLGNNEVGRIALAAHRGVRDFYNTTTDAVGAVASGIAGAGDAISKLVTQGYNDNIVKNFVGDKQQVKSDAGAIQKHSDSLSHLRDYLTNNKQGREVYKRFSLASGRTYDLSKTKDLQRIERESGIASGSLKLYTGKSTQGGGSIDTNQSGVFVHQLEGHLNDVVKNPSHYSSNTINLVSKIENAKTAHEANKYLGELRHSKFADKYQNDKILGQQSTGKILTNAQMKTSSGNTSVHFIDRHTLQGVSNKADSYLKGQGLTINQKDKGGISGIHRLGLADQIINARKKDGSNTSQFWSSKAVTQFASQLGIDTSTQAGQTQLMNTAYGLEKDAEQKGYQAYGQVHTTLGEAKGYGTSKSDTSRVTSQIQAMHMAGVEFNRKLYNTPPRSELTSHVTQRIQDAQNEMEKYQNYLSAHNSQAANTLKGGEDPYLESSGKMKDASTTMETASTNMKQAVSEFIKYNKSQNSRHSVNNGRPNQDSNRPAS